MISATVIDKKETQQPTAHFTPRQLINYHIRFPEKVITNDDIENLVIGCDAVKKLADASWEN